MEYEQCELYILVSLFVIDYDNNPYYQRKNRTKALGFLEAEF